MLSLSILVGSSALAQIGRSVISYPFGESGSQIGADYTTLKSIEYKGRKNYSIGDGRGDTWNRYVDNLYIFDATWEDGHVTSFRMNSDFSLEEATRIVDEIAPVVGRIAKTMRHDLDSVQINPGTGFGGAGPREWSFCYDSSVGTLYDHEYSFEELGFHEAAHSNLSKENETAPGWIWAQEADGDFLTDYARDFYWREDIAVSSDYWNNLRHRRERLSPKMINDAESKAWNRFKYFDNLEWDPYPLNRPVPERFVDNTGLITYEGQWNLNISNNVRDTFTKSLHSTNKAGASANFTFSGVQATYYARKNSDAGVADVYIDGIYMASVDLNSDEASDFQSVYTTPILTAGDHTISIVNSGAPKPNSPNQVGWVTLDAIKYIPAGNSQAPSKPNDLRFRKGQGTVRLDWSANGASDFDSYNLYREGQDGNQILVGPCLKNNFFLDDTLKTNGSYTYSVTALDKLGNESAARSINVNVSSIYEFYDDRSDAVTFSNNWGNWNDSKDYAGTLKYTYTQGATATFTFNGKQARFYGQKRPDLGTFDVYLDGELVDTVSAVNDTAIYQQILYETPVLSNGSHTLTIEVASGQIIADAFSYSAGDIYTERQITPRIRVNGALSETDEVTVNVGDQVALEPANMWTYDGLWTWKGPRSLFFKGRNGINFSKIAATDSGDYRVFYFSQDYKVFASHTFRINVNDPGPPTKLVPFSKFGSSWWAEKATVTVMSGTNVSFGPQPNRNGWTWKGPNGFTSTSREIGINNVSSEDAGIYTATFVNSQGAESKIDFVINLEEESPGENLFGELYTGTRNNFKGWVGYQFEPTRDLTISALGRPVNGFLKDRHAISIWKVSDRNEVARVRVYPSSPMDKNGYVYEFLNEPITLRAGEKYRITSWEKIDSDTWRNYGNISNHSSSIQIQKAVYGNQGNVGYPESTAGGGSVSYGAPTFFFEN